MQIVEERIDGTRAVASKEAKEKRNLARATQNVLDFWQSRHIAAWCQKGENKNLYAIVEDDSEAIEETTDTDDDPQALCLLEDSEHEQWHEVTQVTLPFCGLPELGDVD